jgi:hypothetical protein
MDVNLTGALAANISLLQPSKTEYWSEPQIVDSKLSNST